MTGSGDDMDVKIGGQVKGPELEDATVVRPGVNVREHGRVPDDDREVVFDIRDLSVFYGTFRAVRNVTIPVRRNEITALIGPSGCGKTTVLRCLNRMNDLVEGARIEGKVNYHGVDLYDEDVDAVEVRRRIGMVLDRKSVV